MMSVLYLTRICCLNFFANLPQQLQRILPYLNAIFLFCRFEFNRLKGKYRKLSSNKGNYLYSYPIYGTFHLI